MRQQCDSARSQQTERVRYCQCVLTRSKRMRCSPSHGLTQWSVSSRAELQTGPVSSCLRTDSCPAAADPPPLVVRHRWRCSHPRRPVSSSFTLAWRMPLLVRSALPSMSPLAWAERAAWASPGRPAAVDAASAADVEAGATTTGELHRRGLGRGPIMGGRRGGAWEERWGGGRRQDAME